MSIDEVTLSQSWAPDQQLCASAMTYSFAVRINREKGDHRRMRNTLRRLSSITAVAAFIPVFFVVAPGVASARCGGVNQEVVSNLVVYGNLYVSEQPTAGTCNNNTLYQASFRNETGDSTWRASVWIQNGGTWYAIKYGGYDIGSHSYSYTDSNSYSLMTLCLNNSDGIYYCGWGSQFRVTGPGGPATHDYYGTNSGF